MKRQLLWFAWVFGIVVLLVPADARANPADEPDVIITELQTGSPVSAKDEFIELYNRSSEPVDITGWQVSYINAPTPAAPEPKLVTIAVVAVSGEKPVVLQPRSYYVLRTAMVSVPSSSKEQTYSYKLSSSDKSIVLFAPDLDTCQYVLQDAVAWGSSPKAEGTAVSGSTADHLQRVLDATAEYIDTNNNAHDFVMPAATAISTAPYLAKGATPGADNTRLLTATAAPIITSQPEFAAMAVDGCTLPPAANSQEPDDTVEAEPIGVPLSSHVLIISELLPNPAAPFTDEDDEFVEIYNPSSEPVDLSGYVLKTGSNLSYTYPLGDETIAANSYRVYYVSDTGLLLANSAGRARLLYGNDVVAETEAYEDADEGASWVRLNGTWQWTSTPTPGAANVLTATVLTATTKATNTKAAAKPKAARAAAKPKAAKTTVAKTTKSKKETAERTTYQDPAAANRDTPLHPTMLAAVAGLALVYGAYEYRGDFRNLIYKLRRYRARRRELGQAV